jgi:crotonobetainyl-CoA:carnitine CoA-transferase CaiB-like acyl-CoA transferase
MSCWLDHKKVHWAFSVHLWMAVSRVFSTLGTGRNAPNGMDDQLSSSSSKSPLPLAGVRVLDLGQQAGRLVSRYFADLGADVIRFDLRPADRDAPPAHGVPEVLDVVLDAKKSVAYRGRPDGAALAQLESVLPTIDIVVDDHAPGDFGGVGWSPPELRTAYPSLVLVSLTNFGQTGPYRDWQATDWTQMAMGGVLARSGLPGIAPLMPPVPLPTQGAALQALWCGLLAYYNRLVHGVGEFVDLSVYESVAQIIDPGFGIGGGALAGKSPAEGPRGRPDALHLYPIFPCADGYVRILLQSAKQWRGMRAWMGEPAEFMDPVYDRLIARYEAKDTLYPAIAALCVGRTRDEIVATAQSYGVPAGGVLSLAEVTAVEHFRQRQAFATVATPSGLEAVVPTGFIEVDGERIGHFDTADASETSARPETSTVWDSSPGPTKPLAGLRVLDLGVIIVGAEVGRLLADYGADVLKIESRAFPDGARQSFHGETMSGSFARGNRGKRSFGVNLKSPRGLEIFGRLVQISDVIVSNFKPGTMESLGLGIDALRALNPRIVTVESSALGRTGDWSKRMGYGPLVRANTGITSLWRYPDLAASFCDAATAFPDHVAGRAGVACSLAGLIGELRHGHGATFAISQAEVVITQMTELFAQESLQPGSVEPVGNSRPGDAPRGVYACAGDDEWCVIDVRDSEDWLNCCKVLGRTDLSDDDRFATAADRVSRRTEIDAAVTEWCRLHAPREVMERLQAAGVPAAMMQRYSDLAKDPHLTARGFLHELDQPQIGAPLPVDLASAQFENIEDPSVRISPVQGGDTRAVCSELLGLSSAEIDDLVLAGDLEVALEHATTTSTP